MNEIDNSDIIMITDDGIIAEMIIEVDSGSESLERESFLADAMNEECMDFVASNFNSASNYADECLNGNTDESIRDGHNADALISRPLIETYIKSEVPDDDFVEFIAEVKPKDSSINTQPKHGPTKRKKRKYARRNKLVSKKRKGQNKNLKPLQKQVRLGHGEKLGDIPYIYHQIQKSKQHILKPFYRTLYFSSPSADIDVVKNKILTFSGFPFDKTSLEFYRRKRVMKLLCHQTIKDICLLLGIIFGIKNVMISNILNFLLKPEKELDPLLNICLQPVVQLTKLTEEFIASKVVANEASSSTSTRKANKRKSVRMQRLGEVIRKLRSYDKVESQTEKKLEVPQSSVRRSKEISDTKDTASSITESEEEKKNFPDLHQDTLLEIENFENTKLGNLLHAEESSLDSEYCNKNKNTPRRKRGRSKFVIRGSGEMLCKFPEIKENICKAQQTVLQRLHILLFGKLDKPRKLKENILKFSGFSFKPKSARWLRKEFILSLMSLDKLIEIRNILDLLCNDCKQYDLIASIMKFLEKPEGRLLNSSVCKARNTKGKKKSRAASGKQGKYAKKKMRIKQNNKKKILMDEEELNKLIKMEQAVETWNENINICESSDDLKVSVKKQVYRSLKALSKEESSVAENHSEISTMLKIIHERRAQKDADSTPTSEGGSYAIYGRPKGKGVQLGMIPNVQFMIVTSNYDDLDDLHQLIFMHAAVKSKIRRKILDFNGFHFDENSPYYEVRKLLLEKMGYEVSKRLAFFLGLTPLNTNIPQEDLNDLIMFFLMSPRQIKSVPIRNFPKNFFNTASPRQRPIVELSIKEELESVKPENEVVPKVSKENKEKCKQVSTRANIIKIDVPSTTASTTLLSDEQEDGTESYDSSATDLLNPSYNNEVTVSGNYTEQNTYNDRKSNKREYESERVPPTFNLKNMKFVDRNEIKIKLPIGKSTYSGRVSVLKSSTSDENVSSISQSCAIRCDKISTNNTSTENTESSESDALLSESSGTYKRCKKLMNESQLKKNSHDKSTISLPQSHTLNTQDNLVKVSSSSDTNKVASISSICPDTPLEQNNVLYKYMLKLEPSPEKMSSNVDTKKASESGTSFVKILPAMPQNELKSMPIIQNNVTNRFNMPISTKQLISQSSVMPNAERELVNLIILTPGPAPLLNNNSLKSVTFSDAVLKEQNSSESVMNEDNLTGTDALPCNVPEQSNNDIPQALKDDSSKNSDSLTLNLENANQTEINNLSQSSSEVINCDGNSLTSTALIGDLPVISEQPFPIAVTKTS